MGLGLGLKRARLLQGVTLGRDGRVGLPRASGRGAEKRADGRLRRLGQLSDGHVALCSLQER